MYVQNAPGVAQSAQEARVPSMGRGIPLRPGPPRILVIYIYIYISKCFANPPPCLTLAGHNSRPIFTSLLDQCRARIDDVLGRFKQPSVAILVPLGGTLGAPGRPGDPSGTPWGPFLAKCAKGKKKTESRAQLEVSG